MSKNTKKLIEFINRNDRQLKKIKQSYPSKIIPLILILFVVIVKKYGDYIFPPENTHENARLQEIVQLIAFYGLYILSVGSFTLGIILTLFLLKEIYKHLQTPKNLRDFNTTFMLFIYMFGGVFVSWVGFGLYQYIKNN